MLFGLTNASAMFQSLMNTVLQPFLRKCVLVFFDDILIYSSSWSEHLQHIRAVLSVIRANNLRVKRSKCSFATNSVTYLGHIISVAGVAMDSDKVEVVASWPQPTSARNLWGFLSLAGYYRRFINFTWPILIAMKASKIRCNVSAVTSSLTRTKQRRVTMCVPAPPANVTRSKLSTQQVYYSHLKFLPRSGLISPWTSKKPYQRCMERVSF